VNPIKDLLLYKQWANDLLFGAVSRMPESELTRPRPIIFGSLLRTLNHVHAMDHVWRCHLEGRPHGLTTRNPPECPPFDELDYRQREMDAWYLQYADGLAAGALDHVVEFTFIGGGAGSMSRGEILLHVVNHGTYHRGHVADMMYGTETPPPTTDLPVFLRGRAGERLKDASL